MGGLTVQERVLVISLLILLVTGAVVRYFRYRAIAMEPMAQPSSEQGIPEGDADDSTYAED